MKCCVHCCASAGSTMPWHHPALLRTWALHAQGTPPALATSSNEPLPPQDAGGSSQTEQCCTTSVRRGIVSSARPVTLIAMQVDPIAADFEDCRMHEKDPDCKDRHRKRLMVIVPFVAGAGFVNAPVPANGQIDQPGSRWVPVNEACQIIGNSTVDSPLRAEVRVVKLQTGW